MFGTARASHGGRTAVAIDDAIRRVLAERRRARAEEARQEIFASSEDESGTTSEVAAVSGEFRIETPREPRTRIGRSVRAMRRRVGAMSEQVRSFVGPAGSYERGFILSAGVIVAVLTVLRLVNQTSPWYAIGISALILAAVLAPRLRHGVDMWRGQRYLQGSRLKQMLTCITCAPMFTWCAGPSLGRSTRAALWTSWLGLVGGTIALLGSM